MKNNTPINLDKYISRLRYYFTDGFGLEMVKLGKEWYLVDGSLGGLTPPQRMDGKKVSNVFNTIEAAKDGVRDYLAYMKSPLTRREIRHWFRARWIRGEEQAEEFKAFKQALLDSRWKDAQKIYNKQLSSFSKEAVPYRVVYQIEINL
jgi:hypothetical protein